MSGVGIWAPSWNGSRRWAVQACAAEQWVFIPLAMVQTMIRKGAR